MFRSIVAISATSLLLAGCWAPQNEYDEQLTAIQCTVESNQYRIQIMQCYRASENIKESNASATPSTMNGAQMASVLTVGPGGMVTDPGPGGMVTDPGPGGMVTDPGTGIFYESNNRAILDCRSQVLDLRKELQECFDALAACIDNSSCT